MRLPASINRPVIILGLVSLFTDMASEMLYPVMPIYLTTVLGASMFELGILEGCAEAIASLLKAFFGRLSDRLGRRSAFVVIGYTLSAVSKPLPGLVQRISAVVVARISDRVGKAVRTAPRDALLSAYAPENEQGTVFGFHRAMDTLGAAIGPAVALVYLIFYPGQYVTLFLIAFLPSMVASLLTLAVKEPAGATKLKKGPQGSYRQLLSGPGPLKRLLAATFIFAVGNSSDVFLIMRAKQQGFSDQLAIGAYIAYNLLYAGLSFPLGNLSDRIGKGITMKAGLVLFIAAYLCFAFASSHAVIWAGFGIYAFYASCSESIIKAWISELTPPQFKGTAFGFLTMLMSIGALVASTAGGLLWDRVGPATPFFVAAGCALIAVVILPEYRRQSAR